MTPRPGSLGRGTSDDEHPAHGALALLWLATRIDQDERGDALETQAERIHHRRLALRAWCRRRLGREMATWDCTACSGENAAGMRFCGLCGAPRAADAETSPQTSLPDLFGAAEIAPNGERLGAADQLVQERRLITALFADISGFTALAQQVDSEELLEIVDPIVRAMSDIVARYEGYVEKYAGDAILALFGAPIAHEDDAERALRVALEMHAELAWRRETLPPVARGLLLHVGVNSGHGIARLVGGDARLDYAVLGDAVILAQRLESAAPAGSTYVGETTAALVRDRFELRPVGQIAVKGKDEPVTAWEVVGSNQRPSIRPVGTVGLIGRDAELTDLLRVVERVESGQPGLVTLTGDAGLGKSRLGAALQEVAVDRGWRVLEGRCVSYGATLTYWPLTELLRRFGGIRTDEPPAEAGPRLDAALDAVGLAEEKSLFARLLGLPLPAGEDDPNAGLGPEAFRRALADAFRAWLQALGTRAPTLLVIEDVHWADAASMALVEELARMGFAPRNLFAMSGRPEADVNLGNIADLSIESGATALSLQLGPLDRAGLARMLDDDLGPSSRSLIDLVAERSGGNPLFALEIGRALREEGALHPGPQGWVMRHDLPVDAVPPTVEGLLAARIDRLPGQAATVLQTAAVIGRRVRGPLLQAVVDRPGGVEQAIEALLAAGFLEPAAEGGEGLLVFHHPLMQEVAYGRLLRRRRRELHRRVAEAAERLYGSGDDTIDLLARHLYLAGAGARALDALVQAGERGRRLFANAEAILDYARADEVASSDPALADRLPGIRLALADLHELVGDYEEARRLYGASRDLTGDVRAWRGIAATLRKQGRYDEALRTVDEALSVRAFGDVRPLWLERGWTLIVAGRANEAVEALDVGLALSSEADALSGQLRIQLAQAEEMLGRLDVALDQGRAAEAVFVRVGDQEDLTVALRVIGGTLEALDRLDDAAATLRRALALAERVGSVEEIGASLINLGLVEMKRGRLADAMVCDRLAIVEFDRVGHGAGRAIGYGNLAEKLLKAGQPDEALDYADRALTVARAIDRPFSMADATMTRATIYLEMGRVEEAASGAEEAAALFEHLGDDASAAQSLRFAKDAWTRAGRPDLAAVPIGRAEETSGAG